MEPQFIPLAPSTPPRLHHPTSTTPSTESPVSPATPRPAFPQRLVVDLASPTSPPASYIGAKRRMERPETPLDFQISFDPSLPSSDMGHGDIKPRRGSMDLLQPFPMASRGGTPMPGEQRPEVDPAIKGIPQGWEDDSTIPIPMLSVPSDQAPGVSGQWTASPRKDVDLEPAPMSPSRASNVRMASFRETRMKLSTLGAAMKEKARVPIPASQPSGSQFSRQVAGVNRGGTLSKPRGRPTPNRSSSLRLSPIPTSASQASSLAKMEFSVTREASLLVSEASEPQTAKSFVTSAAESDSPVGLFTPPPDTATTQQQAYEPSLTSTESSVPSLSNRELVMGLRGASSYNHLTAPSKVFLPPNKADVLPWATSNPYSAWDILDESPEEAVPGVEAGVKSKESLLSKGSRSSKREEGSWVEVRGNRGRGSSIGSPVKKVFVGGKDGESAYKVGWERDVLDLYVPSGVSVVKAESREARLHETMYDLAGDSHTFVAYPPGDEPKAVLDIGTASGLWPISQALLWPNTTFVGLDIVPCQTNLQKLVKAEEIARSTSGGSANGGGIWKDMAQRITWSRADFLDTLPYDAGVFDLVHIRFVGLGVPEERWSDLLEEAARVLRPGGHLEIVEMSLDLPGLPHPSLRNSFASLLRADMISPRPSLPVQFALPMITGLRGAAGKGTAATPVFEHTWMSNGEGDGPPGALRDAAMVWSKSALEYTGTGIRRSGDTETVRMLKRALQRMDGKRWSWDLDADEEDGSGGREGGEGVSVWAWVGVKK